MNNLIYVPFKTTKDVALGEALRLIIQQHYFQSPNTFETDLLQISKVRKRISHLEYDNIDKSIEVFLKQYYLNLATLTQKFSNEIIEFEWSGKLGHQVSVQKLRSLKFEMFNVLYQMGSFYSQLAFKENVHKEAGIKAICHYFQTSAGCFERLQEITSRDNFHTNEFSPHSLEYLKCLMLAQAQEMIWQKSVNSNMKNSVIVKLAVETARLYLQCIDHGEKSEFIKLEFINHCHLKYYHFLGVCNYRLSLILLEDGNYGEQVAYLRESVQVTVKGMTYNKDVKNQVIEDLKGLHETVVNSLKNASRENDLIHHKPVPNELPIIQGSRMVKPIIIDEIHESFINDRQIFKDLLPYQIVQNGTALKERQDSFILKKIIQPLQALNKQMNHFLVERQLPALIDSLQKPENIPELIIQHSHDIISYGGTKTVDDLYDVILSLSSDCKDIYEGCSQLLTIDTEEDEFFKEKYGDQWTRPSTLNCDDLNEKIQSMKRYLDQADKADDIIITAYHDIKQYLDLYAGGYESLKQFIPDSEYKVLPDDISILLTEIRGVLDKTQELEVSRKKFLGDLEIKVRDDNISVKLINEYKSLANSGGYKKLADTWFELKFQDYIKTFNFDLEYVESLKVTQHQLENDIDRLNQLLTTKTKNLIQQPDERRDALQVLEDIYLRYLQLITNINEALKFYNDFKTRGVNVVRQCNEFINHRKQEARDLELRLLSGALTS